MTPQRKPFLENTPNQISVDKAPFKLHLGCAQLPSMKHLLRLSDHGLVEGPLPWDFKPTTPPPEEVRKDKKARTVWINRPTTNWHVYSGIIGVNDNQRPTKPDKEGGGNPPLYCWMFVGDYDSPGEESAVIQHARNMTYPPNYCERTFSGHWRFVWVLEKPIRFPSYEFAKHFFTTFEKFAFDPARGYVGFDRPAWQAPERLFTNSADWRECSEKQIPNDVVQGWVVKAMEKFEFSQKEFGSNIPLEVVTPALAEKYESFNTWPGDFVLGSHGPTFWVPESRSPMSATVYENGLRTFSENASKTFYSWGDLLGAAFVKQHQAETAGRASKDIYYDGKFYWRKFPDHCWRNEEAHVLSRHLSVQRGVSRTKAKNELDSDCDRALDHITGSQRVDAALPAVFRPSGFWIDEHSRPMLNTSKVQVMAPAAEPAVWGPGGNLVWISAFLEHLLDREQLEHLIAWAHWGYFHARHNKPRSGQVLFIAGPVGVGKTLINRAILGRIFGGVAEAGPWLMGESNFNGELFGAGFWVIDDACASADASKRRRYSFALKKVAANREFQYNEKFKQAGMTEWLGRVCVTMNCDEASAMSLPDMDISSLDKSMILRTKENKTITFPNDLTDILDRELPYLARYLLDYKLPEHLKGESRYGVKSFAHPSLVDMARQSSPQSGHSELLENWKSEYFTDNSEVLCWEGTATELFMAFGLNPLRQQAASKMSPDSVGRNLSAMKAKGCGWLEVVEGKSENRRWRIWADENHGKNVDNSQNSK